MEFYYALQVFLKEKSINDIPILYREKILHILDFPEGDLLIWVKKEKWQEIKKERDHLEQSGLPFKGSVLDYDSLSVIRLTQAKDGLQEAINLGQITKEEAVIEWTMQDNSTMELSLSDLQMIPLVAVNYSNELHQKAHQYRLQIEESSDISFINNIKWENT